MGLLSAHTAAGTVSGLHSTPGPRPRGEGWKGSGSLLSVGAFSALSQAMQLAQPPCFSCVIHTETPQKPEVPGEAQVGVLFRQQL